MATMTWCVKCGEQLPQDWRYACCEACWGTPCPHGKPEGECDACDFDADRAYDIAREDRLFGRGRR